MTLFLLLSAPVAYFLVNVHFNNSSLHKRVFLTPFLWGMVLSIPYYLIYWSVFHSFFNNWTNSGLYFFYFFKKDGFASIFITAFLYVYYLFFREKTNVSTLREITGYMAGLIFTLGIYDSLVSESWYGLLELFIIPLNRISLIFIVSVFMEKALKAVDWMKFLWIGLTVSVPVLLNFIPFLSSLNKTGLSLMLSVISVIAAYAVYIIEVREEI